VSQAYGTPRPATGIALTIRVTWKNMVHGRGEKFVQDFGQSIVIENRSWETSVYMGNGEFLDLYIHSPKRPHGLVLN
jgi:hypothetical protein